jgi:hypothetical protein
MPRESPKTSNGPSIDDDKLWLLQSRPITTIKSADLKAPPGTWTRKIAEDLWADRLTPLLADAMMRNARRGSTSQKNSQFLKMPVIKPSLTVINGFLYVNCESLKQILSAGSRKISASVNCEPSFPRDLKLIP